MDKSMWTPPYYNPPGGLPLTRNAFLGAAASVEPVKTSARKGPRYIVSQHAADVASTHKL